MKRILTISLLLISCLVIAACGSNTEQETESTTIETSAETTAPSVSYALCDPAHFDKDGWDSFTYRTSNRNNLHSFVTDGTWVYGPSSSGSGTVAKARFDFSDWTVLDKNTNRMLAPCVHVADGYLYYLESPDKKTHDLVKVRTSGTDSNVIITGIGESVQFLENGILYTTDSQHDDEGKLLPDSANLYFCDFNGENQEKVLDFPVFYPTFINDKILYQCDSDNETLHIFDVKTGEDIRLTELPSYWPIFDGEYIYYTARENSEEWIHTLWRIRQDGTGNEKLAVSNSIMCLLMKDEWLYFVNHEDELRIYRCRKDGTDLEQVTQDSNVRDIQFIGDNKIVYTQGKTAINHIYICDLDGANRFEFKK